MESKLATLQEAAALAAGATRIALGGWGFSRKPMRVAMEWVNQGLHFGELLVMTGGIETDVLLAAGLVKRVRSFYLGLEALGMGPGLKLGADVIEETETSLMLGLNAAVQGVSFLPLSTHHGEALSRVRPDLRIVRCPYTEAEYLAIPPTPIDVAYIHAWCADKRGNVVLGGHKGGDRLLALAARRTVVTCEECVDDLSASGLEADLTEPLVDMIVPLPGGAHPTSCMPRYEADWPELMDYTALEQADVARWAKRCAKEAQV